MSTLTRVAAPRVGRLEGVLSGRLGFLLGLWLVQRALLQGIGVLVNALSGPVPNAGPGFFGQLANWDSGYFSCIVRNGYFGPPCGDGENLERFAFFPLYPLVSRGVAWVAGGTELTPTAVAFGMWLVAALASFGALAALYLLVEHLRDRTVARRASVLFVFGPYALFLATSYSEGLYLLGAVGAWYACYRRRYLLTAGFGLVATLSRASGMFLVPALLVLYLTATLHEHRRIRWGQLVLVASPGLGIVGYWAWLGIRTGDPLAWFHAQGLGWNRHTRWPWDTLLNQGIHVLREPRWDWQVQAVLELLFAMGLCVALLLLARARDWPAVVLVGLTAVSLMTSSYYLSLARNTLTLFPLVILLADHTVSRRRYVVCLGLSVALLVFNTVQFATGHWAD